MPDIDAAIYRKLKDQGVRVFGIHPGDPPAQVAAFVEQTGVTFPIVANQGTLSQIVFPDGVGYPYPRDVVVGKDLRVRSIRNSFNAVETRELIEKLLLE